MEQRDDHDRGVAGGGGGVWTRAGAGEGLEGGHLHPGHQHGQRPHLDQPQPQAQALLCQHSQKCAPVLVKYIDENKSCWSRILKMYL